MIAAATVYNQMNESGLDGTVYIYLFVGIAFATVFICILLFHVYLTLRETADSVWKKLKLNELL